MKYLLILMVLVPLSVFAYTDKDCSNKCASDQACMLDSQTGNYSCGYACKKPCQDNQECKKLEIGTWECAAKRHYEAKNCDSKCQKNEKCKLDVKLKGYYCGK
jgi:hypothetical protein